ncbi:hypothetical protein HK101_004448, partial [Irineochytrium annulatum]
AQYVAQSEPQYVMQSTAPQYAYTPPFGSGVVYVPVGGGAKVKKHKEKHSGRLGGETKAERRVRKEERRKRKAERQQRNAERKLAREAAGQAAVENAESRDVEMTNGDRDDDVILIDDDDEGPVIPEQRKQLVTTAPAVVPTSTLPPAVVSSMPSRTVIPSMPPQIVDSPGPVRKTASPVFVSAHPPTHPTPNTTPQLRHPDLPSRPQTTKGTATTSRRGSEASASGPPAHVGAAPAAAPYVSRTAGMFPVGRPRPRVAESAASAAAAAVAGMEKQAEWVKLSNAVKESDRAQVARGEVPQASMAEALTPAKEIEETVYTECKDNRDSYIAMNRELMSQMHIMFQQGYLQDSKSLSADPPSIPTAPTFESQHRRPSTEAAFVSSLKSPLPVKIPTSVTIPVPPPAISDAVAKKPQARRPDTRNKKRPTATISSPYMFNPIPRLPGTGRPQQPSGQVALQPPLQSPTTPFPPQQVEQAQAPRAQQLQHLPQYQPMARPPLATKQLPSPQVVSQQQAPVEQQLPHQPQPLPPHSAQREPSPPVDPQEPPPPQQPQRTPSSQLEQLAQLAEQAQLAMQAQQAPGQAVEHAPSHMPQLQEQQQHPPSPQQPSHKEPAPSQIPVPPQQPPKPPQVEHQQHHQPPSQQPAHGYYAYVYSGHPPHAASYTPPAVAPSYS